MYRISAGDSSVGDGGVTYLTTLFFLKCVQDTEGGTLRRISALRSRQQHQQQHSAGLHRTSLLCPTLAVPVEPSG